MQRKTLKGKDLHLKEEDEGTFSAVFATLDVVDKNGDVIVPGAIKEG